jgi:hypothetical protein
MEDRKGSGGSFVGRRGGLMEMSLVGQLNREASQTN